MLHSLAQGSAVLHRIAQRSAVQLEGMEEWKGSRCRDLAATED